VGGAGRNDRARPQRTPTLYSSPQARGREVAGVEAGDGSGGGRARRRAVQGLRARRACGSAAGGAEARSEGRGTAKLTRPAGECGVGRDPGGARPSPFRARRWKEKARARGCCTPRPSSLRTDRPLPARRRRHPARHRPPPPPPIRRRCRRPSVGRGGGGIGINSQTVKSALASSPAARSAGKGIQAAPQQKPGSPSRACGAPGMTGRASRKRPQGRRRRFPFAPNRDMHVFRALRCALGRI
jgi:hypothetical protein